MGCWKETTDVKNDGHGNYLCPTCRGEVKPSKSEIRAKINALSNTHYVGGKMTNLNNLSEIWNLQKQLGE